MSLIYYIWVIYIIYIYDYSYILVYIIQIRWIANNNLVNRNKWISVFNKLTINTIYLIICIKILFQNNL